MGTLTLTELENEIRASMGGRTDFDSRLPQALNIAQNRIARIRNWEELESLYTGATAFTSTPADDKFLALPVGIRKIFSVRLIDGLNSRKLTRVPHKTWDRKIPAAQEYSTGRPSLYTQYRSIMEFWRVPDAAYVLHCRTIDWPTAFAAASPDATSDLDEKDDMLIALALSWMFMTIKNEAMARKWWGVYSGMLNDAVGEDAEKPDLDYLPDVGAAGAVGAVPYYQDPFVNSI